MNFSIIPSNEEVIVHSNFLRESSVPVAPSEYDRVKTLRETNLMDSLDCEIFEKYVRLLTRIFKVPGAFISLIDLKRKLFLARFGIPFSEIPREMSSCNHTIMEESPQLVYVPDCLEDDRFLSNPFFRGNPMCRFYVGVSIIVNRMKIGTVCIFDGKVHPEGFSDRDKEIMIGVTNAVADFIERRRQHHLAMERESCAVYSSIVTFAQIPYRQVFQCYQELFSLWKQLLNKTQQVSIPEFRTLVKKFDGDVHEMIKFVNNVLHLVVRLLYVQQIQACMLSLPDQLDVATTNLSTVGTIAVVKTSDIFASTSKLNAFLPIQSMVYCDFQSTNAEMENILFDSCLYKMQKLSFTNNLPNSFANISKEVQDKIHIVFRREQNEDNKEEIEFDQALFTHPDLLTLIIDVLKRKFNTLITTAIDENNIKKAAGEYEFDNMSITVDILSDPTTTKSVEFNASQTIQDNPRERETSISAYYVHNIKLGYNFRFKRNESFVPPVPELVDNNQATSLFAEYFANEISAIQDILQRINGDFHVFNSNLDYHHYETVMNILIPCYVFVGGHTEGSSKKSVATKSGGNSVKHGQMVTRMSMSEQQRIDLQQDDFPPITSSTLTAFRKEKSSSETVCAIIEVPQQSASHSPAISYTLSTSIPYVISTKMINSLHNMISSFPYHNTTKQANYQVHQNKVFIVPMDEPVDIQNRDTAIQQHNLEQPEPCEPLEEVNKSWLEHLTGRRYAKHEIIHPEKLNKKAGTVVSIHDEHDPVDEHLQAKISH